MAIKLVHVYTMGTMLFPNTGNIDPKKILAMYKIASIAFKTYPCIPFTFYVFKSLK